MCYCISSPNQTQIDPDHPDNNDRDAGRICDQCNHDLELNADFRCVRCGA